MHVEYKKDEERGRTVSMRKKEGAGGAEGEIKEKESRTGTGRVRGRRRI